MRATILIVEDDPVIRDILIMNLREEYHLVVAQTGAEAQKKYEKNPPDLVLLDLGLPDMDGMQLLRMFKEKSFAPIIVVSARERETDKVMALDAGADDYVEKPFGNEELLARIRRSLRQTPFLPSSYRVGEFEIDFDKRKVTMGQVAIHLTPIEYEIVAFLSENSGKVLTHEQILHKVWGPFEADNQVLRVNMANIRRKIEVNSADPIYFLTEVGVGYRLADAEDLK